MPPTSPKIQPAAWLPAVPPWLAQVMILVAVLLAYVNSLQVPFLFDDVPTITENPAISQRSGFDEALTPSRQAGLTIGGRPVARLSFQLNWKISGDRVWSYHIVNVLIHAAAALALFDVLRRTFSQLGMAGRFADAAVPLALAITLIWALHPLQTESVTYIVQRVESLVGLFYLLTLYAVIRAAEDGARNPRAWSIAAVAMCLCGMGTKEVMASAPLIVLLYDRTFITGTFRAAWSRRRWLYAALASTWLWLGWLVFAASGRGGTVGLNGLLSPYTYGLTQCYAIVHYVRLAFWPSPLVFDYGTWTASFFGEVWFPALVLAGLLAATLRALWRNSPMGFVGAWFFAVLAPSSSIVPIVTQTMAEHRFYLALAAVVTAVISGLYLWFGRVALGAGLAIAVVFGFTTAQRNTVYRSAIAIWTDTIAKRPNNARAHHNYGLELWRAGQTTEAIAEYGEALRLYPEDPAAHNNLGLLLLDQGHLLEAGEHFATALRQKPGMAEAYNNIGNLRLREGHAPQALAAYEEAIRFKPDYVPAHVNAGNVLLDLNRKREAAVHYEIALRIDPNESTAANNLGGLLTEFGEYSAAVERYQQALRIKPDLDEACHNLVLVLEKLGRRPEAEKYCRIYLGRHPDDPGMKATLERLNRGG